MSNLFLHKLQYDLVNQGAVIFRRWIPNLQKVGWSGTRLPYFGNEKYTFFNMLVTLYISVIKISLTPYFPFQIFMTPYIWDPPFSDEKENPLLFQYYIHDK